MNKKYKRRIILGDTNSNIIDDSSPAKVSPVNELPKNSSKFSSAFKYIFLVVLLSFIYSGYLLYEKHLYYNRLIVAIEKEYGVIVDKSPDLSNKQPEKNSPKEKSKLKEPEEEPPEKFEPEDGEVDKSISTGEYKSVHELTQYKIVYIKSDNSVEKKASGSVAWRLNNPGRIGYGDFAKLHGAIGSDKQSNFAIFSSYKVGLKALEIMLFDQLALGYKDKSVSVAINKFVPDDIADEYLAEILKNVKGISASTIMGKLNKEQRKQFITAVEQLEQVYVGKVTIYKNLKQFKEKG